MNGSLIFGSIAAAVIALLSGLGIGSGGLFVILLTGLLGFDPVAARGLNLLFFVFSAASSMAIHLRRRRVDRTLLLGILPGCAAALAGARLAENIPTETLRLLFGILLILSGGAGLLSLFFARTDGKGDKKGKIAEKHRRKRENSCKNS